MNKVFSLIIILSATYFTAVSQKIEIGKDANEIKSLIEWTTNDHNRADSYGNVSNSQWSWDVKYYNGQISKVIQCYQNEYIIDFRIVADFCKIFMMENEKLSSIITRYENVSIEKLKGFLDKSYGEKKMGDFYFSDDFKRCSKAYLSTEGYATVEMQNTNVKVLPKDVRAKVESYFNEQTRQDSIARAKKKQEADSSFAKAKKDLPSIESMKQDLMGKKLYCFLTNKSWDFVKPEEILELKIVDGKFNNEKGEYDQTIEMKLQDYQTKKNYDASAIIIYSLNPRSLIWDYKSLICRKYDEVKF